jgi:predicted DNA-binding transcriptional regulator YafY
MRTLSVRDVRETGAVLDTSARLLRLLSLLQARTFWRGDELAARLEVTDRTLRRDVTRLRSLGYPIDAGSGPYGGYRLGSGGSLPPLLLDDDEAVAVAVGLRTAAGGTVVGLEEAAIGALAKLEQVLPAPLHHRVSSLSSSTIALTVNPHVDAGALVIIANACRGLERLRFTYRDRNDNESERTVEPYRLVHTGRRWYLVARDVRAEDWRTFRVDRMTDPQGTGHRFVLDDPPDAAALVERGMAVGAYSVQVTVRVAATPAEVHQFVPSTVAITQPDGDGSRLTVGADTFEWIAGFLVGLPWPFEVLDPPEIRKALRKLSLRIARDHRG